MTYHHEHSQKAVERINILFSFCMFRRILLVTFHEENSFIIILWLMRICNVFQLNLMISLLFA